MPRRSDRKVFSKAFDGNPFEGMNPQEIYKKIKWGNNPKEIIKLNAPEPLVSLGYLAAIYFVNSKNDLEYDENRIHLAVGSDSNLLYIFKKNTRNIPNFNHNWLFQGLVQETHYYSDKGGEDCYYYHEHEKPYPGLYTNPIGNVAMIVPENFKGQRSYAVIKEGIVG